MHLRHRSMLQGALILNLFICMFIKKRVCETVLGFVIAVVFSLQGWAVNRSASYIVHSYTRNNDVDSYSNSYYMTNYIKNHDNAYTNAFNANIWQVQTSVFECRLEQKIPAYGKAVFLTRAGESAIFQLKTQVALLKAGEAYVEATAPVWADDKSMFDLGVVSVKQGRTPLWLDTSRAEQMIATLRKGMDIEIKHPLWFGSLEGEARLTMSAMGFHDQYQQYLQCLNGLLPANFYQLERTALYFPAGPANPADALSRNAIRKLDNILQFVTYDKTIKHFYVDGHTDSAGDRVANLELSKERAEMVAQYLIQNGIPDTSMTVRWHGERYPAASNADKSGRAKNRRVTVRLERGKAAKTLPLVTNAQ